jgi:DNA repair protein RecO (recombination protein O)
MSIRLQPAYVLHRREYRDTSLIVELLTPDHGRLSAVARGARRASGRRPGQGALLQPFLALLVSLSGGSELKTLTSIESQEIRPQLQGETLYSALYVNELVMRLLHRDDPHPEVFESYRLALSQLAGGQATDLVLRRFEFSLLEELGYGFDLWTDGASGEPLVDAMDFTPSMVWCAYGSRPGSAACSMAVICWRWPAVNSRRRSGGWPSC